MPRSDASNYYARRGTSTLFGDGLVGSDENWRSSPALSTLPGRISEMEIDRTGCAAGNPSMQASSCVIYWIMATWMESQNAMDRVFANGRTADTTLLINRLERGFLGRAGHRLVSVLETSHGIDVTRPTSSTKTARALI